jgi:hypothetical protein
VVLALDRGAELAQARLQGSIPPRENGFSASSPRTT